MLNFGNYFRNEANNLISSSKKQHRTKRAHQKGPEAGQGFPYQHQDLPRPNRPAAGLVRQRRQRHGMFRNPARTRHRPEPTPTTTTRQSKGGSGKFGKFFTFFSLRADPTHPQTHVVHTACHESI